MKQYASKSELKTLPVKMEESLVKDISHIHMHNTVVPKQADKLTLLDQKSNSD